MSSEKHLDGETRELSEFKECFYIGMPDLKAAAFGNVNLSDLESQIVVLDFACVRRKWFFSRFLSFFPLLV